MEPQFGFDPVGDLIKSQKEKFGKMDADHDGKPDFVEIKQDLEDAEKLTKSFLSKVTLDQFVSALLFHFPQATHADASDFLAGLAKLQSVEKRLEAIAKSFL